MNRRGFLTLFASAIATAVVPGIKPAPGALPTARRVHARHLYGYNGDFEKFFHRIDVRYGIKQWHVDIMSQSQTLTRRELEAALATLNTVIGRDDVAVGEILTYSVEQWHDNRSAQAHWDKSA